MSVASFPRPFPIADKVVKQKSVFPYRRSAGWMLENGEDHVVDRGQPQWMGQFGFRDMDRADFRKAEAWTASLRGPQRTFTLPDPDHDYPAAYMPAGWGVLTRSGGGAFDGTCSISDIDDSGLTGASRDVVTLGGSAKLPVGLLLGPGDHLALEESGRISLHMVLDGETLTADADGALTAWIEPEVPSSFTTAAVCRLLKPSAKWRLMDFTEDTNADGRARPNSASLKCISTLRAEP